MNTRSFTFRNLAEPLCGSSSTSSQRIRAARVAVAVLCTVMLLAVFSLPVRAQTVSFAGLQATVPAGGLNQPQTVAVDGAGDVFIADTGNNRVVEVPVGCRSSSCQITVASGLNSPEGVAVDGFGNVFIGDTHNHRVVEVPVGCTSSSCQTTVGSGLNLPAGLAVDEVDDLFIADFNNNWVVEVPAGCTSSSCQSTLGSGLNGPASVAVDLAGDLFIADYYNGRVVEIPVGCTTSSCQITLGSGLRYPAGVALDGLGDVFIADTGNGRVVDVPAGCTSGSCQNTVGSGLSGPLGLASDGAGDVFIADTYHYRVVEVQRVAINFGAVNIGSNTAVALSYNINASVTLGASPVVVTQGTPNLDFTISGTPSCTGSQTAGNTCSVTVSFGPTAPGSRMGAVQLMDSLGNLLVTTMLRGQGLGPAVAFPGGTQTTVGSGLNQPVGVSVDALGNTFIADSKNNQVVEVPAGCNSSSCQITLASDLKGPAAAVVDGAGDVLIADYGNSRVLEIPAGCTSSSCQTTVGSGLIFAGGVAADGAGNVFISDTGQNQVVEVPAGCTSSSCQATVGSGLNTPFGVVLDGGGDVFIADYLNNRVVEVSANCIPDSCQTTVGSGLSSPPGVAVDAAGDVLIADLGNNRVIEVPAGCTGSSCQTPVGSGLNNASGLAVDGLGDVFIADTNNSRVVEVQASLAPSLTFPGTAVGSTSSPQTITVQNIGNAALTFSSFVASANFTVDAATTTCSTSSPLAVGASCNVGVASAPTTGGSLAGTLTLTDNALNNATSTQSVQLSVQGTQAPQTITFTIPAPSSAPYSSSFTVAATASSGLAVVYGSSGSCSNAGTTYTMTIGTGICTVTANQPGNAEYAAAPPVTETVNAILASQTITFTTSAPASAAYGSGFSVAATASSGLTVAFTSSGACTNAGTTYTMTSGTGACSVIANQAGDGVNYAAAPQMTETTSATPASQTITVSVSAPATATNHSSFTITATANSGLPITFSSSGACTNSGATYTINAASGTCTETMAQTGNSNYASAPTVIESTKVVAAIKPNVSFTGAPSAAQYQSTFTVVASSTNDPSVPTVTSTGPCTVSNTLVNGTTVSATVTMTSGTGTCVAKAAWASNTTYSAASLTQETTAEKLSSGLAWTTPAAITYGTALSATQLDATASVAGTLVYTPAKGAILAVGTQTLSVTFTPAQPADYTKETATVQLVVNPATTTTTITAHTPNPSKVGGAVKVSFTVAGGKPTGSVTVNASTGESCTGTLTSGKGSCSITFTTSGARTLTGSYPGDANDSPSVSALVTQTVN